MDNVSDENGNFASNGISEEETATQLRYSCDKIRKRNIYRVSDTLRFAQKN